MSKRTPALLQALKEILHRKRDNAYYAKVLGVKEKDIEWAREELRNKGVNICSVTRERNRAEAIAGNYISELESHIVKFEENIKEETAYMEANVAEEIRNLDELVKKCNIDTSVWEIEKYVQNYWGNRSNPHWQVKAWLGKKKVDKTAVLANMLKNYKSSYRPVSERQLLQNKSFDRPSLLYLALTDVHIDKYESKKLSLAEKIEQYQNVLRSLVLKAYSSYYVDEILFVIGHDWFNSDTYFVTTTAGTQQFNNSEWDEAYDKGFDAQVWAISFLKQFCNRLIVKFVPGNHDRTKTYFMVHALEQQFKDEPSIVFDRKSESTKSHTYGECFIGMHHGDTKIENLPLYCANKFYKEWGKCKYKEIGVGDKHHKKQYKLYLEDTEIDGVRLFMTPSFGGHGKWDRQQLYDNSIQAGIARVYDKERGKCGEFEERI